MYIDGQWINAKNNATFPVFNPANGEKIWDVPNGDREDAAGAIDAAQRAFEKWSSLTAYQRSGFLYEAYRIMTANNLEKGYFYAPTILTDIKEKMLIYREETFGSVAALISFETEEEVLAMANDTRYGLASYVYTRDISRAMRAFEALRFGIVGINDINPTAAAAPFGGMKESGIGREGGCEGIAEYLETKLGGFSV